MTFRGSKRFRATALSFAKRGIGAALNHAGLLDARIEAGLGQGPLWLIATYHRVQPKAATDPFTASMSVPTKLFAEQISYIKRNFETLQVGEVVRRLEAGQVLPPRVASITFDDGYRDNLHHAAPLLRELGVPWSLYVTTGGIDRAEGFWWDRALIALRNWPTSTIDLRELGLGRFAEPVTLAKPDRDYIAAELVGRLWSLPHSDVLRTLDFLETRSETTGAEGVPRLSWHEIADLHGSGVEIGAHSVRHPNMALLNVAEASREASESRRILQEITGGRVSGFAYPGGRFTEATLDAVAALGFSYGLSTQTGLNRPDFRLPQLRRVSMPTLSLSDFKRAFVGISKLDASGRRTQGRP